MNSPSLFGIKRESLSRMRVYLSVELALLGAAIALSEIFPMVGTVGLSIFAVRALLNYNSIGKMMTRFDDATN